MPGVGLVCEAWDFACKNKEFQLLAPLTILWRGGWGEGWRELELLSGFNLSFVLSSCGTETRARGELTRKY
jgi:hypothetical protein